MNNAWPITGPINHVWALVDQQAVVEATTLQPPTRTCSRTIQGSCRKLRRPQHAKVTATTIIIGKKHVLKKYDQFALKILAAFGEVYNLGVKVRNMKMDLTFMALGFGSGNEH